MLPNKRPGHDDKRPTKHAPPLGDGWKGALPAVPAKLVVMPGWQKRQEQKMYRVKATLDSKKKWIYLSAENDSDAMMEAIGYILDEAMTSKIWANGMIELINPAGQVIKTMEAK